MLSVPVLKSNAGCQQPHIQIWTPSENGGYGLRLPSTLEASLSLSNFLYRVAAPTLVGDLTRHRLTDYSRDAGYTSCALRHPTAPSRLVRTLKGQLAPTPNKVSNHVAHINRILHELGFSIDTDEINISRNFAHVDCELVDLLPASTRHILAPTMAAHSLYFLSQLTTADSRSLIPYSTLRTTLHKPPRDETKAD